jgi:hypothetical protein
MQRKFAGHDQPSEGRGARFEQRHPATTGRLLRPPGGEVVARHAGIGSLRIGGIEEEQPARGLRN